MNIQDLLGRHYNALRDVTGLQNLEIPPLEAIEDQSYISVFAFGISLVLSDHRTISAIHLHGDTSEGFDVYPFALPLGLRFGMSRDEVRVLLGEPEQKGEETVVPILGKKPAWDRFAARDIRVHVEYSGSPPAARLVTLTR
jgi:hypothetical protein